MAGTDQLGKGQAGNRRRDPPRRIRQGQGGCTVRQERGGVQPAGDPLRGVLVLLCEERGGGRRGGALPGSCSEPIPDGAASVLRFRVCQRDERGEAGREDHKGTGVQLRPGLLRRGGAAGVLGAELRKPGLPEPILRRGDPKALRPLAGFVAGDARPLKTAAL